MARVDAKTRKAALLEALRSLIEERPLGEIGVGDVTSAAGLGRSAFYFYFPSKTAAIAELLAQPYREVSETVEQYFLVESGADALRGAIEHVMRAWREHEALLLAMHAAGASDPDARDVWDGWFEDFVARIARRIEVEREAGSVPPGPGAELLARALVGMNVHMLSLPATDDAALLDALTEVWQRAIYAAPG